MSYCKKNEVLSKTGSTINNWLGEWIISQTSTDFQHYSIPFFAAFSNPEQVILTLFRNLLCI
ncbi:hypothetical protein MAR_017748 [Mya arenaria]|uniref:Uncharacterized protein n=1 Tax=Mya arenaria TaxID=6604 RepID=A0ABY7ECQ4_MYAAR|nr:hypothetical protein MAR_017748 [Mya arenaria]